MCVLLVITLYTIFDVGIFFTSSDHGARNESASRRSRPRVRDGKVQFKGFDVVISVMNTDVLYVKGDSNFLYRV